jgi:hypothetical protein
MHLHHPKCRYQRQGQGIGTLCPVFCLDCSMVKDLQSGAPGVVALPLAQKTIKLVIATP